MLLRLHIHMPIWRYISERAHLGKAIDPRHRTRSKSPKRTECEIESFKLQRWGTYNVQCRFSSVAEETFEDVLPRNSGAPRYCRWTIKSKDTQSESPGPPNFNVAHHSGPQAKVQNKSKGRADQKTKTHQH